MSTKFDGKGLVIKHWAIKDKKTRSLRFILILKKGTLQNILLLITYLFAGSVQSSSPISTKMSLIWSKTLCSQKFSSSPSDSSNEIKSILGSSFSMTMFSSSIQVHFKTIAPTTILSPSSLPRTILFQIFRISSGRYFDWTRIVSILRTRFSFLSIGP